MKELLNKADNLALQIADAERLDLPIEDVYELQNQLDETLYEIRQLN